MGVMRGEGGGGCMLNCIILAHVSCVPPLRDTRHSL